MWLCRWREKLGCERSARVTCMQAISALNTHMGRKDRGKREAGEGGRGRKTDFCTISQEFCMWFTL